MEAWRIYYDEFVQRADRVRQQPFERDQAFAEAAHEAYRRASDQLTREHGWEEDRALFLMRGLNAATKLWIGTDGESFDGLKQRLRGIAAEADGAYRL